MRQLIAGIALVLLVLTYGVSLSLRDTSVLPESLDATNHPGFYDYRGAINVQSEVSSGFMPTARIIQAAQDRRLDFLIFNEMNRFLPNQAGEGWQRQTLVLSGGKYSYLDSRLLCLNPERLSASESIGQAQTVIADLLSVVGPNELSRSQRQNSEERDILILSQNEPFTDSNGPSSVLKSSRPRVFGVEAINVHGSLVEFSKRDRVSFFWSLLIFPFNPDLALIRAFADFDTSFPSWDRISLEMPTFGVLGIDAGARFPFLGIRWSLPSYDSLFRLASHHVLLRSELTGDLESDRTKILKAIRTGQSYFAFDSLGQTKGFAAWLDEGSNIRPLGSRVRVGDALRLVVRLPKKPDVPFETVILRDGVSVMTSNSTETDFRIHKPGAYRIVVRLFTSMSLFDGGRWVPWIMTNPIVVTPRNSP